MDSELRKKIFEIGMSLAQIEMGGEFPEDTIEEYAQRRFGLPKEWTRQMIDFYYDNVTLLQ